MFGDITDIVESAPTLGKGLEAASRSFGIHQEQSSLTIERRSASIIIAYKICDGRIVSRHQDALLTLGALVTLLRRTFGKNWTPEEIHFEQITAGALNFGKLLDAPVYYGQATNAIVIPLEALSAAMPKVDPQRHGDLLRSAGRHLANRGEDNFIGLVMHHTRDMLTHGTPGIDHVASKLGLSGPALYRKLFACGMEFSDIQRELRCELALLYLTDLDVPLTEIALALGYSELSAFSRAFRSWTGLSPRAYRCSYLPTKPATETSVMLLG
jgi:AraC-like DNA-binding protein